jgi:ankyrin repeat protein
MSTARRWPGPATSRRGSSAPSSSVPASPPAAPTPTAGRSLLELAAGDRAPDGATTARLIASGPVDEPAVDGTKPFFHAACHDHLELADALLAAGADPNAVSRGIGWTAPATARSVQTDT